MTQDDFKDVIARWGVEGAKFTKFICTRNHAYHEQTSHDEAEDVAIKEKPAPKR